MRTKTIYLLVTALVFTGCVVTQKGSQKMTEFDRNIQPQPGPAPRINPGSPKTFTLANGLRVLVVENHKLPRVSASLQIDNKPVPEGEKAGVFAVLRNMLGNGTQHISKDEFHEKVDFLGASIYYGSQSARMQSLSKFFPEVFSLMADGALYPVFTQEEFDKQIAHTLDGIKSGEKNVQNIASRVENTLAYGKNHPFGEFMTEKSVKNIKLSDVRNVYRTYYKPDNAYLVIVGDVDFESTKDLVTREFSGWKRGHLPETALPEVQNVPETELDFIDMPNASQSQVSVVSTAKLTMNDEDYFPVLIANQILGGDFNSYLNMNLREAHGYTYGARSSLRPNRYISKFHTSAQVRNSVVDSTVVETIKEIQRIRNEKVDATTLKNVKAGYAGKFVMAVEKPETVARYALNIAINQLPEDFYKTYLEKINAVSIADVQRVANKYFNIDNARIVVTSKGSEVIPALEKLGYTIHYFDKYGNPAQKPEIPKTIPAGLTPEKVLDTYFAAMGGKTRLEAVQTLEQVYEMHMQGMLMTQKIRMQKPNKMAMETLIMGQTSFKMVFDGTNGYMEQMGVKTPMQEEQSEELKSKKALFDELTLTDASASLSMEGIVSLNGHEVYKMIILRDKIKQIKYFDTKTGLLIRDEKIGKGLDGKDIIVPTTYSGYKPVEGIMFPYTIETKIMGQDVEMHLKSIKLNTVFSEETFQ